MRFFLESSLGSPLLLSLGFVYGPLDLIVDIAYGIWIEWKLARIRRGALRRNAGLRLVRRSTGSHARAARIRRIGDRCIERAEIDRLYVYKAGRVVLEFKSNWEN